MSELDEIREKYERGELDKVKEDLERFLLAHRQSIREYRDEQRSKGSSMADDELVKIYILRHRTINPGRDIAEQLDEIQKEKWIRGVHLGRPPDPREVVEDWSRLYSAAWRQHRLNEIAYVFNMDKERYLRLLW